MHLEQTDIVRRTDMAMPLPMGDLRHILQIAHDNAAACVNDDPELYHRLTGRPAPELALPEEQVRQYRKAAAVLEAPYLSSRQQQVAAGIAVLIGYNTQNHYNQDALGKECNARRTTVRTALSILTGVRDEFTPPQAQMTEYPLVVGVERGRRKFYTSTGALRWLIEQPDDAVPVIFRFGRESARRKSLIDN